MGSKLYVGGLPYSVTGDRLAGNLFGTWDGGIGQRDFR